MLSLTVISCPAISVLHDVIAGLDQLVMTLLAPPLEHVVWQLIPRTTQT